MILDDPQTARRFLFLQGPHGPFFSALGRNLTATGAKVWRVGFNKGDEAFWRAPNYIPFTQDLTNWHAFLSDLLSKHRITDLVCYGAARPVHKVACHLAKQKGLITHVFEEGYIRPYWVTYERGGANATSPAMSLTVDQMQAALSHAKYHLTEAPDHWGDMSEHMFWGATYHAFLLRCQKRYPNYRPHRAPGVLSEFRLHLKRFLETPVRALNRRIETSRVRSGGFPYHLILLQLAHDANFQEHGPFPTQSDFLETVFRGFATGAPRHHHLVLKAHPLEDGREPLRPLIRQLTEKYNLDNRVHFICGGKLARLLDAAKSAVTVNSTAAEQALWRGLPLKAFGKAVYNRPEFVSAQSLQEFFAAPNLPDRNAYLSYRAFLLATSQIPGGFYALRNRRKLLRQLPDLMLAQESLHQRLLADANRDATTPQHLHII